MVAFTLNDLESVLSGRDSVVIDAKVKVLTELIKHHIKEEERKALPELKAAHIDLMQLGESVLLRKQQLMRQLQGKAKKASSGSKKHRASTARAAKSTTKGRSKRSPSTRSRKKS